MRFINSILVILVICVAPIFASQLPYLQVNLNPGFFGMFSVFSYVAGVLYEYDTHAYAGIEVDFQKLGFYYDPACGPNWWEYYCEPICLGNKKESHVKQFSDAEYMYYAYFPLKQLNRYQVHNIIQKYIKIKSQIQAKVDRFVVENFKGYHVIGVHYRGTDKMMLETPFLPYHEVLTQINSYLRENNIQNYRFFVASDEAKFVEFMNNAFADLVFTYSTQRSNDGTPLHLKLANNCLYGEEALIDCLLLSRGDFLIRTTSNLSLWSTYFNPKIPVIELSKRYDEMH